jgi:acyl-CoA reductase-like NAD-dependent aldehyde dehydrogenase
MAGSWTRVRLTIVLDDADLELAASAGAWGSFLHQGADSSRG